MHGLYSYIKHSYEAAGIVPFEPIIPSIIEYHGHISPTIPHMALLFHAVPIITPI